MHNKIFYLNNMMLLVVLLLYLLRYSNGQCAEPKCIGGQYFSTGLTNCYSCSAGTYKPDICNSATCNSYLLQSILNINTNNNLRASLYFMC